MILSVIYKIQEQLPNRRGGISSLHEIPSDALLPHFSIVGGRLLVPDLPTAKLKSMVPTNLTFQRR